jgi:hypothetical protein
MAEPDPNNAFASFDPAAKPKDSGLPTLTSPTPGAASNDNAFAGFDPLAGAKDESKTSALGAATRGLVGGALPALAGGLPGAAAGFALGEAIFPAGGGIPGALLGLGLGFGGAAAGSAAVEGAQHWALEKVPKFRDLLGQSEEQKRLDEQEHPVASFLGGTVPWFVTMSPFGAGKKLAENATTWERLANNSYTKRLFPASIVGGMQLGQEAVSEDKINWNRVAVATGFGLVFNKPTAIGNTISEFGARPVRAVFGGPVAREAARPPTIAETNESTAGPGLTEPVFQGSEERNPAAAMAARS